MNYSICIGTTLTSQDKVETGSVKMQTYHAYIKAAGGYLMALLVFCILFSNVGSMAFSSWWLVVWIKAGGGVSRLFIKNTE